MGDSMIYKIRKMQAQPEIQRRQGARTQNQKLRHKICLLKWHALKNCLLLLKILSLEYQIRQVNDIKPAQRTRPIVLPKAPLSISGVLTSIYVTDYFCLSKRQITLHCLLLPYHTSQKWVISPILISCFRNGAGRVL